MELGIPANNLSLGYNWFKSPYYVFIYHLFIVVKIKINARKPLSPVFIFYRFPCLELYIYQDAQVDRTRIILLDMLLLRR
jgi:hypothetical protein